MSPKLLTVEVTQENISCSPAGCRTFCMPQSHGGPDGAKWDAERTKHFLQYAQHLLDLVGTELGVEVLVSFWLSQEWISLRLRISVSVVATDDVAVIALASGPD